MSYPTDADLRRDRAEQAQAGLTRPKAEAWSPTVEGESIAGDLVRVEHGDSKYGTYPILILVDAAGVEHAVWLFHTVLADQVKQHCPQLGDTVAILYEGPRKPKGGGDSYKAYKVSVVPAAGATIDWSNGGQRGGTVTPDQLAAQPRPAAEPPEPPLEPAPVCDDCGHPPPVHAAGCPADPPPY